jgi:hypothetical protein
MNKQILIHSSYHNTKTIFILICMILTICLFLFLPGKIRSFMFHRSSSSSNEINHRYQLLSTFSTEDLPTNIKIL